MADWTNEQKWSVASLVPYFIGPVPAVANYLMGGVHSNEDMEAINRYMREAIPATKEGRLALADWDSWWVTLDWWDKNVSTEAFDKARNLFHKFVVANQPTQQGKESIKEVLARGITTEEIEGNPRRSDEEGNFPEPTSEIVKTGTWIGAALGVSVLIGVAVGVSKLVSNPLILFQGRRRRSRHYYDD